eukprot:357678-Chlamydomonas_euryale.AAC.6
MQHRSGLLACLCRQLIGLPLQTACWLASADSLSENCLCRQPLSKLKGATTLPGRGVGSERLEPGS